LKYVEHRLSVWAICKGYTCSLSTME